MEKSLRAVFKELGISGLKQLEVVSAIYKGNVFEILPTSFGKLFSIHYCNARLVDKIQDCTRMLSGKFNPLRNHLECL